MGCRLGGMKKLSLAYLPKVIVIIAPGRTAFGMDFEPERTNLLTQKEIPLHLPGQCAHMSQRRYRSQVR